MGRIVTVWILLAAVYVVSPAAQQPAATFEVASIRASQLGGISITVQDGIVGAPSMKVTGTRVEISKLALAELVARAYGVRSYQLVGPASLNGGRFDIQATLPQGTDSSAVPGMLRRLLEERFGMVAHLEQRLLPVYELVVRPEGVRLGPPVDKTRVFPELTTSDGTAVHPDVARARTFLRSTPETDGFVRVDGIVTVEELAQFLSGRLDLPVLDRTSIAGYYQLSMRMLSGDYQSTSRAVTVSEPIGSSWFKAMERLGLELKRTRAELPVIVVDKIEPAPTEN